MSTAITYQAQKYKPGELKPGDVILSNHPIAGGTHLPDITTITPVFDSEENPTEIIFFVANRGHHADVGGIQPGSMPPDSTELWQEGASFDSFLVVRQGAFDEEGLTRILYDIPAQYPGSSGTRTLHDNIADLKAAIASNQKGIQLIHSLVQEYSWPITDFYMRAVRENAAQAVRTLLKSFAKAYHGEILSAVDYNDDGVPFVLNITIDEKSGDAVFDFTGTGPEHYGNLNCPPACMYSSIMVCCPLFFFFFFLIGVPNNIQYCIRSMVTTDIPLNQGCLEPIKIICPPGTILTPSLEAATVGCTSETSQRIVDVILHAFNAAAASQGSMNNLTFGYGGTDPKTGKIVKGFGYYETIAGGAGAGADWVGASGVHSHLTNTRMTVSIAKKKKKKKGGFQEEKRSS